MNFASSVWLNKCIYLMFNLDDFCICFSWYYMTVQVIEVWLCCYLVLISKFNGSKTWPILALQWRNNERHVISNHLRHNCLLNRLFRRSSKKTTKLSVTCLYEGNSPVTGKFPAQKDSNAEIVSIWWRHLVNLLLVGVLQHRCHVFQVVRIYQNGLIGIKGSAPGIHIATNELRPWPRRLGKRLPGVTLCLMVRKSEIR